MHVRLQVYSTKQFIEKTPEERASIMRTFTETEIEDVEEAIASMPHFDIEYQAFVKVNASDDRPALTRAFPFMKTYWSVWCRATTTTLQHSCSTFASPRRKR